MIKTLLGKYFSSKFINIYLMFDKCLMHQLEKKHFISILNSLYSDFHSESEECFYSVGKSGAQPNAF